MEFSFETEQSDLNAHAQPFVPFARIIAERNIERRHQPQFQYQADPYFGTAMPYYYLAPLSPTTKIAPTISRNSFSEEEIVPVAPASSNRHELKPRKTKRKDITKKSIRARVNADFIRHHYEALATPLPPQATTIVPISVHESNRFSHFTSH